MKINSQNFSFMELSQIYNQNRKLIYNFINQIECFKDSGFKINILVFIILFKNNRNLSFACNFTKKFLTVKFEYFFSFNLSRVCDIELENSILNSWEDLYLQNLVINNSQLCKKLALDDIFIQKDSDYNWSQLIKFKSYKVTIVNNFHFDLANILLLKFHIIGELDKVKILSQLMTNNKEELKILLNQYRNFIHRLLPNKKILHKNEIILEDLKEEFLKNVFKFLKNKNYQSRTNYISVLNLFTYLKKFYHFKENMNLIYFFFYLIVYFYNNNNFALKVQKHYIKDLNIFLNNPETEKKYEEAIKLFFNKPSLKNKIFYKDEMSTKYLILVLEIIMFNTLEIEKYFLYSSNQEILTFIFFIIKIINNLNVKNKIKNRMINSQGREEINCYIISHLGNYEFRDKLEKLIMNIIFFFLNKNKSCLDINNLMVFMHLKTNIKSYKKLITDKIINFLEDDISKNLRVFVFDMKNKSYKDIRDNCFKHSITDTNHITPNFFFNFLLKVNFKNLNKNQNLQALHNLFTSLKNLLLFLNFIFEKNKFKKEFLNILKRTNNDKEFTKNLYYKKYLNLLEKIQKLTLSIYLSFLVFNLLIMINNSDKTSSDQSMISMFRCYLILSIYYNIKYPDRDSLFMNVLIDTFYIIVKNCKFDMDLMTLFYSFGDLSYRSENKEIKIEEIQNIIRKSSDVIFDKLVNLNKKKQHFLNCLNPLDEFQNFLSSVELSHFIYFKESLIEILGNKLLDNKIIISIKNERCKIKKNSLDIYANLDSLIDFKKLFSRNSHDDNLNLFSKLICRNRQDFCEVYLKKFDSVSGPNINKVEKKQINNDKYFNTEINKNKDENTFVIKYNKQFSNMNILDESDYSIDNISNISDLSLISNNQILAKQNYSNISLNNNTIENQTLYEKIEDLEQNELKVKVIKINNEESNLSTISNIMYIRENESSLIHDSLEIKNTLDSKVFQYIPIKVKENNISTTTINIAKSYIPSEREINKSLKNVKIKKSNELQISYEDKKKKYISLKIFQNIISKRILYLKEKKFRLLKSIYNNLTNQIEFTQIITLNNKKDKHFICYQDERKKKNS